MKSAGKARNNGLYRHIRTSKEIIRNLLNDSYKNSYLFSVAQDRADFILRGCCLVQEWLRNLAGFATVMSWASFS